MSNDRVLADGIPLACGSLVPIAKRLDRIAGLLMVITGVLILGILSLWMHWR